MAAWDALAKAADMPLAVFLGGSLGAVAGLQQQRPLADRCLCAWRGGQRRSLPKAVSRPEAAARPREVSTDDLAAIAAVRRAAGEDIKLMVDFNQGLSLGDALHRCHALDDQGLYWMEEPIAYSNLAGYAQLARELKTPIQLGENFYGPRALYPSSRHGARRLCHARSDANRRRNAVGCAAPPLLERQASRCRRTSIRSSPRI